MKIAIFNPYKRIYAAENSVDYVYEKIKSIDNIDIEIKSFCSPEEIVNFKPEFILSHSSFTPKFCNIPTYTVFNESTSYRLKHNNQIRAFLTFDGYLTQSNYIVQALQDLCFGYNKVAHILSFANTRTKTQITNDLVLKDPKLAYFANNWEVKSGNSVGSKKPRFESLITELASNQKVNFLELYGDPGGWSWIKNQNYIKGKVSFSDPDALLKIYHNKGVGLALSSHEFYKEGLANNRIYEIVSSGAVCIADDLPFYKEIFGDNLLYLTSRDEKIMAEQIIVHMSWIQNNPELAKEKALNAQRIFCEKLSMEVMIKNLIDFHHQIQQKNFYNIGYKALSEKSDKPLVSVIIRSGGRPKEMVEKTLNSVVNQSYDNIQIVFVLYKDNAELKDFAQTYKEKVSDLIIINSSSPIRSTVMWEGLKVATGDYLAILDDDDIWYPNHLSKMIEFFDNNQDADFVYSGRVYYNSFEAYPMKPVIGGGASYFYDLLHDLKLLTNERSNYCLGGFGKTDYNEMLKLNHPIHLCFVVKKSVLNAKILEDPVMNFAEDLYFCVLLYKLGLKFYWMPELTVQINIHDNNSQCDENEAIHIRDRIALRIFGKPTWCDLKSFLDQEKQISVIYKHGKKKRFKKVRKFIYFLRGKIRSIKGQS